MKEILLSQGFKAMVDDSDYDWINQWKWTVKKGRTTYYAKRRIEIDGVQRTIYLHRQIMSTPKGMQVDHIDHNGLNCQRYNMRNCTNQENARNKKPMSISGLLGVTHNGKYIKCQIKVNDKNIHLGNFKTEKDAALAYNNAAKKYFGEFANLNII